MSPQNPEPRERSPERLVTIAAFREPIEAHLARTRLECEGVACKLADEHIVGVYGGASSAVGGVKLQVRERDRERALRILEETSARPATSAEWLTADLDAPRCGSCGSLRLQREPLGPARSFVVWLLLGLPLPFLQRWQRCRRCGQRWPLKTP
ncbi:MAG: DUF2007 domain-containing protein [Deltaproteobacteria bacterium]|nr:DUF2007 domain-containing protein [Deltaproteobacteria bacterium]